MRHRKHTFMIGRKPAHRRSDMANMTCSLLEHGQVKTTLARAKELRRMADKMITLGKRGTLHARRQAVAKLKQKPVVKVLFDEIAPQYTERPGGYTRLIKLGKRTGDAAEMCFVQLVREPFEAKARKNAEPEVEGREATESDSGKEASEETVKEQAESEDEGEKQASEADEEVAEDASEAEAEAEADDDEGKGQ
ncbi:MAG: 50S ribosomal protein L17 [Lentisphaeria bacterium]